MTSRKKGSLWLRFLAAFLVLTMTVVFTGCNSESESSSESSDVSGDENEQLEPHKVGYIFREEVDFGGFAKQICEQRLRASNRSGVETCYIDGVTITDFENAVKALSDEGCTDIVSCSSVFVNVLNSVAKKYLDLNFISFGAITEGVNVSAYSESPYQGAYIAGLVANFNSKVKKIGVVTDPSLPDAVAVVNAVELGAEITQDGGSIVYAAGAEMNNEIERAIDALIGKGCDVIVCYTNSPHSEDYCEKRGVKFIGCLDYSEREHDYSKMLMYFYCQRDSYFLAQFKSMKMDNWSTTEYIGDMSNSIVNVSSAMDICDDGTQALIDTLVPYLTSGAAVVFRGPLKDNTGVVKYLETDILTEQEIANMNWLVKGVEQVGDFRTQNGSLIPSDFEIEY